MFAPFQVYIMYTWNFFEESGKSGNTIRMCYLDTIIDIRENWLAVGYLAHTT